LLIVGELINTSRKAVKQAVDEKDAASIQKLAEQQVKDGATYVDINCGKGWGASLQGGILPCNARLCAL
jgi:cobalamin-dependent methionine synthase I